MLNCIRECAHYNIYTIYNVVIGNYNSKTRIMKNILCFLHKPVYYIIETKADLIDVDVRRLSDYWGKAVSNSLLDPAVTSRQYRWGLPDIV